MHDRMPLGIEGGANTGKPVSATSAVVLVIIIILAFVTVYYYFPKGYETDEEKQEVSIKGAFTECYSDDGIDSDDDGRYDYLNIAVGINVSENGKYSVDCSLHINESIMYGSNTEDLYAGNQTITLSFNGLNIYLQRVNTFYMLRNITLRVIKENTSFKLDYRDAYNTSFYNYTDFQNSVHIDKTGTITGSSSNTTLKSDEYSFDVKEIAAQIDVSVNYTIDKTIVAPNSRIDIYLYYYNETTGENELIAENKNGDVSKTISINAQHTGKWIVLVHHYSDITTTNTATYTLTIGVVYE